MQLTPKKIPKAAKGKIKPNKDFNFSVRLNAPAAEVQRPIIKLAQNKETKGATALSSVPNFCFINSGRLLAVETSTPT